MHILASEDPRRNFRNGISMISISIVQLVWIYSGLTFVPYVREIILAIGLPSGIGLITWSRIQVNRRNQGVSTSSTDSGLETT